ncbi:serine/threonine-protein kinase 11-interacting protein [Lepisosteus oculatus]|uniref:serine/threonine-protein kinase 11-interacting protein n=1 Tax=Lepisosteus oculatus TaxID=7918 RepID=UPI0035F524A9
MAAPESGGSTLVHSLASLLRNNGDSVLDGTSTLSLMASSLQHLTCLFEQYLLSRTHQHGFLALPSHPADTASLLQVQFLFDMLQKTISLKLFNPPGSRLQSAVKIFPFKSLRYLELKRIPPHCLEGLRAVYSQLEVFICSKSLHSVEELISLCGGDLSTALSWLELHTLNFSYNSITSLDDSLTLLNVLKSLDLSHNKIQDCAKYLMPLSELEHLNLGYNFLQKVPTLGQSWRAKLVTLVLRNNELETIDGVEHLSSLQHLDLAYNLLMEHSQLAPLSQLHCLSTLKLEGNPLYFQRAHRFSVIKHISPKAACLKLKLDGFLLSASELAVLPKPGQLIGQIVQNTPQEVILSERGTQDVSSGGGELSDSLSLSESGAARLCRKKSKSKIKVRRASISEPSDTDYESRAQNASLDIVLPHQKAIERMDSFRHQLGEDWLQYKHHLEGTQVIQANTGSVPKQSSLANMTVDQNPRAPHQIVVNHKTGSQGPQVKSLIGPLLTSEPKEEMSEVEDTESTLQYTGHSQEGTESVLEWSEPTLEVSAQELESEGPEEEGKEQLEEEEDDFEVDLCVPLVVGVLPVDMCPKETVSRLFLRVKPGHVLEVDMKSGRILAKLELDSLREVTASQATWTEKGEEISLPVLELHFSYISRARQRRQYVMLDEDPQQALQSLAEVLTRIAEENVHKVSQGQPECERLQCLKCKLEFTQRVEEERCVLLPPHVGSMKPAEAGQDTADAVANALICPECNSDHVVQLPGQSDQYTSTPVQSQSEQNFSILQITFVDSSAHIDIEESQMHTNCPIGYSSVCSTVASDKARTENGKLQVKEQSAQLDSAVDSFYSAKSGTFYIGEETEGEGESWGDMKCQQPASFHSTDGNTVTCKDSSFSNGLAGKVIANVEDLTGSFCYSPPKELQSQAEHTEQSSPAQYNLLVADFQTVDHRLKLFFDVEVFEENSEELQCFLKMSTVKYGDPGEFSSLLVVSDRWIYILEIVSETLGQPSEWLRKRESHKLSELSYLEVGLGSQSIHMEFEDSGTAYTMLIRDSNRCKHFFSLLTGIVRDLAPKSDSKLKSISTARLNPQHHLWPLLCENVEADAPEDCQLQFFYLLAFLLKVDVVAPVTLLVTQDTLYLLNEDHQWSKTLPSQASSGNTESLGEKIQVQETQPISCVSSIHLFSSDQCRVSIKLYDEIAKDEKTWQLRTESPELQKGLVEWIRIQWEAMFGVKLTICLQE